MVSQARQKLIGGVIKLYSADTGLASLLAKRAGNSIGLPPVFESARPAKWLQVTGRRLKTWNPKPGT
jgi:hypothetical protein